MKVLALLLDAAEKDLLVEWAEAGLLPTFRRLLSVSLRATTEAPLAMQAGAIWPSLATAASPARHSRHTNRQIRVGTYETYRVDTTPLGCEPFWAALGRAGRRVAVVDVPEVPLMRESDVVQIRSWTAHEADCPFETWPPHLEQEISRRFGRNEIGLCDHLLLDGVDSLTRFRDALLDEIERKVALCRDFATREDWDLFLVTFGEAHCIGHRCWHLHDPSHPRHSPEQAARLGDLMLVVYRALDRALAELVELAGPETTLFVLATHGMGPNYNGDHLLEDVLAALGHGRAYSPPGPLWQSLRWAWRRLPLGLRDRLTATQKHAVDAVWPSFDPEASCFKVLNAEMWSGVRVNLAGREPRGKIRPGAEYDAFCAALGRDLAALVNADTGGPAVLRVLRSADVYDGPRIDQLPDLLVEWSAAAPLRSVHSPKTGTIRRAYTGPRTGHHKGDGLLLASGLGIAPGALTERIPITHLAPTLCALLGVTLEDVDGRPIEACLPRPEAERTSA